MIKNKYKLPREIILWGGTGQAKAVRPIIEYYGSKVVAVFDDTPNLIPPFSDIPLYLGWEGFKSWLSTCSRIENIGFCIAIGNPHGKVRLKLHDLLSKEGLKPTIIIHPTAMIADNAIIGEGSQIMAGASILLEVVIGRQCIINCQSVVEHETKIDDAVEIGQNSTILGLVHIGANTHIGAGSILLSRITIGSDVTIGAGSIVAKNLIDSETYGGVTNRPI